MAIEYYLGDCDCKEKTCLSRRHRKDTVSLFFKKHKNGEFQILNDNVSCSLELSYPILFKFEHAYKLIKDMKEGHLLITLHDWINSQLSIISKLLPDLVEKSPASFSCGDQIGYKKALLDILDFLEKCAKNDSED